MFQSTADWLIKNWIELSGAVLGLLYIYFSIRQNILTWPTGLLTSALYTYVFFQSKFYADMGLQVYYVGISIYGWYYWIKGTKTSSNAHETKNLPVTKTGSNLLLKLIGISMVVYVLILFLLLNFTDSDVPFLDSLTTALSIVATWMLARKLIEHWLIWIFVDLLSAGLYVYKNLWPTVVLFIVYTIMALLGYRQWKKELS